MGNAVHQMLVNASAQTVLVLLNSGIGVFLSVVAVHRNRAAHRPVDQLLRLVDAVRNRDHNHRLAVKAGHLHVLVSRNDNGVRPGDLGPGQHVLCAAGAVGLRLQGDSHFFSSIFQILRRHVGVGDAGGTCRHGQDR